MAPTSADSILAALVSRRARLAPEKLDASLREVLERRSRGQEASLLSVLVDAGHIDAEEAATLKGLRAPYARRCTQCAVTTYLALEGRAEDTPCEACGGPLGDTGAAPSGRLNGPTAARSPSGAGPETRRLKLALGACVLLAVVGFGVRLLTRSAGPVWVTDPKLMAKAAIRRGVPLVLYLSDPARAPENTRVSEVVLADPRIQALGEDCVWFQESSATGLAHAEHQNDLRPLRLADGSHPPVIFVVRLTATGEGFVRRELLTGERLVDASALVAAIEASSGLAPIITCNEFWAVEHLTRIRTAQTMMRIRRGTFGTIADLTAEGLLDDDTGVLTELIAGYRFEAAGDAVRWVAVASPLTPGESGRHYFGYGGVPDPMLVLDAQLDQDTGPLLASPTAAFAVSGAQFEAPRDATEWKQPKHAPSRLIR